MRKYLAILAAVVALGVFSDAHALTIDTSAIARTGHRGFAAEIRPLLANQLQKALGPRFGARATVRITKIYLAPHGGQGADEIEDRLHGVVIVPGRGAIPIIVSLPPSASGAWYTPNVDERRVYRLIEAFAGWVARSI